MANENHDGIGRIESAITPGTLVAQTIAFIREQLASWRDDPDRPYEDAEDQLNLQLCKFLDARARNQFPMVCFHHEEFQVGRRRVDMSATPAITVLIGARSYTIYDPILVCEGKRLPAPSADRETEYVTGGDRKSGGIQRFKLGLHGAALSVAAMIGYVQGRSLHDWHQLINSWIADLASCKRSDGCTWRDAEVLGLLNEDGARNVADCVSLHDRSADSDRSAIQLHHLWILMASAHTTS